MNASQMQAKTNIPAVPRRIPAGGTSNVRLPGCSFMTTRLPAGCSKRSTGNPVSTTATRSSIAIRGGSGTAGSEATL